MKNQYIFNTVLLLLLLFMFPALVSADINNQEPHRAIDQFPHTENFSSTGFPPAGWQNIAVTGNFPWERVAAGFFPSASPLTGNALITYRSNDWEFDWSAALITPAFNLSEGNYRVRFTMYRDTGYPYSSDRVEVLANTQPQLSGATLLGTVNRPTRMHPQEDSAGWYDYDFQVPVLGSDNSQVYFIFKAISDFGNNLHIDAIHIEEVPTQTILTITPEDIFMGKLPAGEQTSVRSVQLSNTGTGTLLINENDILLNGQNADEFQILSISYPIEMPPGNSYELFIKFTPQEEGEKNASVVISHSGINSPSQINITAEAYYPLYEFFEDFSCSAVPGLPPGWHKVAPDTDTGPIVHTTDNPAYYPVSPPNQIRLHNALFTQVELLAITPKVTGFQENLLSFFAFGHESQLQVGFITDPENVDSFQHVLSFYLSDTHTEYTVDLSNIEPQAAYLAFRHGLGSYYKNIFIDNVSWAARPPQPIFSIDPLSKDFGSQQIELASQTQIFTISNLGDAPLHISPDQITLVGRDTSDFLLSNLQQAIALSPGESDTISVAFVPGSKGEKTAAIKIFDNISRDSFHLVNLNGKGVDYNLYNVAFFVTDNDEQPLENIIIELDQDTSLTTNNHGKAFIELLSGDYSFSISAEGYMPVTDHGFVVDSDHQEITVMLEPEILYTVVFNVHMHSSGIDQEADQVYISGEMNGWAMPGDQPQQQLMNPHDNDHMIRSITFELAAGSYQYMYYLNSGWQGAEWQQGGNRHIEIYDHVEINNVFGDPTDTSLSAFSPRGQEIIIYPVPAENFLNFSSSGIIKNIKIFNLSGQLLKAAYPDKKQYYMDISSLNNGIYLIEMLTPEGVFSGKILKQTR